MFSVFVVMYHALYFPRCTFTLYSTCFAFFVIDHTRRQTFSFKWFSFVFIKDRSSVLRAVTAENEEQYILSYKIYFKLQKCCFFSLRSTVKGVLLKCRKISWIELVMEFISSAKLLAEGAQIYQKYFPLQVFFNVLP